MSNFPYKDEDIDSWIYDQVPDKMELATSEKQIRINTLILYKSSFSSLAGYFIATKVNMTNMDCVKHYLQRGKVYIKKNGV
jgi:hypothetical protein